MPELPEVETIRRQLLLQAVGQCIESVRVCRERAIRAHTSREEFIRLLDHATILDIVRRGKALLFLLDNDRSLLVRLGMSGRLVTSDPAEPAVPHTHVFLHLSNNIELRYIDPRTFGQMAVVEGHDPDCMIELSHYGIEPLSEDFTPGTLKEILAGKRTLIQSVLMDQTKITGIGKIYADEACFLAGIHPERAAESVSEVEIDRLHAAIRQVLNQAIAARGTSSLDAAYRDAAGDVGGFQHHLHVYQQAGRPCRVCGTLVEYRPFQGRRMHFCPHCQR